jgi:hypothetical protein
MGSFVNLTRGADVQFGAVALHIDNCIVGTVEKCNFLKCNGRDQPSIYLRWGEPVVFTDCCFVESEFFERRMNALIHWSSCRFEAVCTVNEARGSVTGLILLLVPVLAVALWVVFRRRGAQKQM